MNNLFKQVEWVNITDKLKKEWKLDNEKKEKKQSKIIFFRRAVLRRDKK